MMKLSRTLFTSICLAGMLALSAHSSAEDFMDADAIKALVTGKTIHALHLKKDFEFKVFFDPDGETAYRSQGGEVTETTYKFVGNKHCIYWKEKDRCANILDNGDGTYTRVNKKGKKIVKWTKFEDGKTFE